MPYLEQSDAEVRTCADCAARLARGESTPLTHFNVRTLPLVLLCAHEVEVEMQGARDDVTALRGG